MNELNCFSDYIFFFLGLMVFIFTLYVNLKKPKKESAEIK